MKYLIAPAALALAFVAPAQATAIIQQQSIDISSAPAPETLTLSFAQFDSSLGTLESIELSFASSLVLSGSVTNISSASHNYTLNGSSKATLIGNGFNFSETLASGPISIGTIGKHATKLLAPISGAGSDSATILSGFTPYLGLGTVDFTFASTKNFNLTPAAATLDLLAKVGGSATLTYNYEAAVPEPASWALMLFGFGGMGAVMRVRRRAVAFG